MQKSVSNARRAAEPTKLPVTRVIAKGPHWRVSEYVCTAGPDDRPFEEQHTAFTIAAVVEGTFNYRSEAGTALLHDGALLLGNHGACYACGHEHSHGDRCISLTLAPDLFSEIAATAAGSARYRFRSAMLPSCPEILPWFVRLEASPHTLSRLEADEAMIDVAERVVSVSSSSTPHCVTLSSLDARRVSRAVQYIAENAAEDLSLDDIATEVATSPYHFLRTFRRATSLTPYQFVLELRLRRAALQLIATGEAVSRIAFMAGFGDLSTFNARFKRRFGLTPRAFRAREGRQIPSGRSN